MEQTPSWKANGLTIGLHPEPDESSLHFFTLFPHYPPAYALVLPAVSSLHVFLPKFCTHSPVIWISPLNTTALILLFLFEQRTIKYSVLNQAALILEPLSDMQQVWCEFKRPMQYFLTLAVFTYLLQGCATLLRTLLPLVWGSTHTILYISTTTN